MTQPKIPEKPPVGSAEFYVAMLRDSPRNSNNFYAYAVGLIAHIVDDHGLAIHERLNRIRSVVAAVELIRDESPVAPSADQRRDAASGCEPASVVHFLFVPGDTACMLDRLPEGATATTDAAQVTCSGCRRSLKLDESIAEAH